MPSSCAAPSDAQSVALSTRCGPVTPRLVGSLAVTGQLAIDLAACALDLDGANLSAFLATLRESPLLTLTVYTVGPSLLVSRYVHGGGARLDSHARRS
jgi:hypothetical protein